MEAKGVDIPLEQKKIILGLLTHPRMVSLRDEFHSELVKVLSKPAGLKEIAQTASVNQPELKERGSQLADALGKDRDFDDKALEQHAQTAMAFLLSTGFLSFWGHFTSTLQKLFRDNALIGEVADSCGGHYSLDSVRLAIRQFSDSRRMAVGKAGDSMSSK
jgi:hypothetical protein